MATNDLPFIDRHCIDILVSKDRTWVALGEILSRSFGGIGSTTIARALGTDHRSVMGPPLVVGSSIVGFQVTHSQPERHVVLAGEHRFSRYTLTFELDDDELCAITHADFPGIHGATYRALLLRTGGHVLAVKRLLGLIKTRAEKTR